MCQRVVRIAPGVGRKWQPVARMWPDVDVIAQGIGRK
jgi:hypothetical protein